MILLTLSRTFPILVASLGVCVTSSCSSAHTTAAASPQNALPTLLQRHGYQAVPLTLDKNEIYTFHTSINAHPATLILDSGDNGTITLASDSARDWGVRVAAGGTMAGDAYTSTYDTGHVQQFSIGVMQFGPQATGIGGYIVPGTQGAIGATFLRNHHAIMDFATGVLYLQPSLQSDFVLQPEMVKPQADIVLPLIMYAKNGKTMYYINVVMDTIPKLLEIDTGSGDDVDLDMNLLIDVAAVQKLFRSGSSNINIPSKPSPRRVTVGPLQLDSVDFGVVNLDQVTAIAKARGYPAIQGLLGAGLLRKHQAILDFGRGMLYLHR